MVHTVTQVIEWLNEFPSTATVSFCTSAADGDEYIILSLYPREDCEDNEAKHVFIDLGHIDV